MPEARDRRPSMPLDVANALARHRDSFFFLPNPDPISLGPAPRNSIFGLVSFKAPRTSIGRGGRARRGTGRSVLPSWYPRKPLQDITAIVRAIERRRARLGQQTGNPASVTSPNPAGESEFLTPQNKLLNSTDKVDKVVQEELQKLKGTPSAQKAAREKRTGRTLMSLR